MFERLKKYIKKKHEQSYAFNQLHRMSDRELKDLGIGRSQIYNVVYNGEERTDQ